MIAEVLINTILIMLGLAAAAFILLVAVGLLMVMYDEIEERVD